MPPIKYSINFIDPTRGNCKNDPHEGLEWILWYLQETRLQINPQTAFMIVVRIRIMLYHFSNGCMAATAVQCSSNVIVGRHT